MSLVRGKKCVIAGLRRGVNEVFALPRCCAAYIGSQSPTFRDKLCVNLRYITSQKREDLVEIVYCLLIVRLGTPFDVM